MVMLGLVLVFSGFAGLGLWLAAAGKGAAWQAIPGIAALVCFSVGFPLLGFVVRRRGGLMRSPLSRSEVEIYRARYRRRRAA